MPKSKTVESGDAQVVYRATRPRAESIGLVQAGQEVDLSWLNDEQIAFVLVRGYYLPSDWALVPENIKALYDEMR